MKSCRVKKPRLAPLDVRVFGTIGATPAFAREDLVASGRFHTWGNRRGPLSAREDANQVWRRGFIPGETDRGSIRCIGRLAPEDRCLCSECFRQRCDRGGTTI